MFNIYICIRLEESRGISRTATNVYVEILKNFKNLKALLIYNLEKLKYNYASWNACIKNAGSEEIKEMCEVKAFKRYILFSKLIYKT